MLLLIFSAFLHQLFDSTFSEKVAFLRGKNPHKKFSCTPLGSGWTFIFSPWPAGHDAKNPNLIRRRLMESIIFYIECKSSRKFSTSQSDWGYSFGWRDWRWWGTLTGPAGPLKRRERQVKHSIDQSVATGYITLTWYRKPCPDSLPTP